MPGKRNIPHLLEMSTAEQRKFLDSFDIAFSDCDGVVWMIVGPIPRAGDGVRALQRAGKRCVFVSNNSLRTDEEYQAKFKAIGADPVDNSDLLHPVKAIHAYLKEHMPNEHIYSIASDTANEYLLRNGVDLEVTSVEKKLALSDVPGLLKLKHKVSAVVLDVNINLTYIEVVMACEYLKRDENCVFIVGGLDTHMPLTKDITVPGFASTINHISSFTKKQPIVLGKPSDDLAQFIKKIFNITDPQRCLFLGDSLLQDVGFGKKCGFQTLFIASTGSYNKNDMLAAAEEYQPDFYCDGIEDFAKLIESVKNGS